MRMFYIFQIIAAFINKALKPLDIALIRRSTVDRLLQENGRLSDEIAVFESETTLQSEPDLITANKALPAATSEVAKSDVGDESESADPTTIPVTPEEAKFCPSVLIVTVPKSGTIYINRLLTNGLNSENFPVSPGYFPVDLADLTRLEIFAQGGKVASEHLDANRQNLRLLSKYAKKWIVHIRDPRSVVLSWAHHVDRLLGSNPETLDYWWGVLPRDYSQFSLEQKIDFNIAAFLPEVVKWTQDWLNVVDSGKYKILLTTYDDLVSNEIGLVNRILDFFEIPGGSYSSPAIEKTVEISHFRSGKTDEWREAFTRRQIADANSLIGSDLLQRFVWSIE